MFTVNLEKALIKQNKKVLLPSELLAIQEYEKLGDDFCKNEILDRTGLNRVVKEGKSGKLKIQKSEALLSKFDKTRVFHISQIEAICNKYHLRFLKVDMYKGSVDKELAAKISQFEIANDTLCDRYNCSIVAPASSFRLERRPKDPLFFKHIGNGYWYLIHKWGNDLSLFRRLLPILSNGFVTWLVALALPSVILYAASQYISFPPALVTKDGSNIIEVVVCLLCFAGPLLQTIIWLAEGTAIRLIKKNEWDSMFLD